MTAGLAGVYAKIARSKSHINGTCLDDECGRNPGVDSLIHGYLHENFDGVVTKQDPNTGQPLVPAHLCSAPLELSIATGDAIHNLHSALDHLAWALVASNGGTPSESTHFPLLLQEPTDSKGKPVPLTVHGNVSSGALTEIERLQPYKARHPSSAAMTPLGKLRELSNVDKHRFVPLMVTSTAIGTFTRVYDSKTAIRWEVLNYLDDGADFGPAEPEMYMEGHLVLQVSIPPSIPVGRHPPAFPVGGEPLYSTLMLIQREVKRVVDILAPFVT